MNSASDSRDTPIACCTESRGLDRALGVICGRVGACAPRTYLIFGDIKGKLDVLNVECTKCAPKGRYQHELIEKYGREARCASQSELGRIRGSVGCFTDEHCSCSAPARVSRRRCRVAQSLPRRPVYGGSDLVCVRGGWSALDVLPMPSQARAAVAAARLYDQAVAEYPGFTASRRPM